MSGMDMFEVPQSRLEELTKERPILFGSEMVHAILDGRKTQTRRVVRFPQHYAGLTPDDISPNSFWVAHCLNCKKCKVGKPCGRKYWQCGDDILSQQYHPGDRLWVRETWKTVKSYDHLSPSRIPKGSRNWPSVWFACSPKWSSYYDKSYPFAGKVRPAIFMPRWASRILLEIVSTRLERLQDISQSDIDAEIGKGTFAWEDKGENYPHYFACLWDSINAKRGYSWESNPFVWVIEFKKVEPP